MVHGTARALAVAGVVAIGAAGCGGGGGGEKGSNADRYPGGPKKEIATAIDNLQGDARGGNADAICSDLMTARFAGAIGSRAGSSCPKQVERQFSDKHATFTIRSIVIRGRKAVAAVIDRAGRSDGFLFVVQDGRWRLDNVYNLPG